MNASLLLTTILLQPALLAQALLREQPVDTWAGLPPLQSNAKAVAAADLDGDGDDDLVVCEDQEVAVYLRGAGTWTRSVATVSTNSQPTEVAIADFDGDGNLDLVAAPFGQLYHATQLRFVWGDGSGQFGGAPTLDLGTYHEFRGGLLTPCDVDHDGLPDLVMSRATGTVGSRLLRNAGNRSFSEALPADYPQLDCGICEAHCIDLDGDSFDDILLLSRTGRTRLLWNANGSFAEAVAGTELPVVQQSLRGLAVADFDGDGDLDLACGGDEGPGLTLTRVGLRQFVVASTTSPPCTRSVALHVADQDGDGDLDLHVFRTEAGELLLNDGAGSFTFAGTFGSADLTATVVPADLDDDDDVDLLRLGNTQYFQATLPVARVAASLAVLPGLFEHRGDVRLPPCVRSASTETGDIDGDGLQDILLYIGVPGTSNSYHQFCRNDGRGVFTFDFADRWVGNGGGFFADLDGDGRDEYVMCGPTTGWFANSGGRLAATATPLPIAWQTDDGAALDVDGDGDPELAFAVRIGGLAYVRILEFDGLSWVDRTSTLVYAPAFLPSSSPSQQIVAANLDGDPELELWAFSAAGSLLLDNQNGVMTFVANASSTSLTGGYGSAVGDLDGDGDLDLRAGRRLYRNDGNLVFTDISTRIPNVSGFDTLASLVDIDDDGDLDLTGQCVAAWNDGSANFTLATGVNSCVYSSGASLVWTDMDRDGDPDLVATLGSGATCVVHTNMLRHYRVEPPTRVGGALELRYQTQPGQDPLPVLVWMLCCFTRTPPTPIPDLGFAQLALNELIVLGGHAIPATGGLAQHSQPLPPSPALVGVVLYSQPVELRGGRFRIGNLVQAAIDR